MQLSLQADYSCRVLIYLAANERGKSSIEAIAAAYGISENHLVKVVHRLGKLGFIETSRGRGGGIRLGREPEGIMIGEVVRAMEPNLELVECFTPETNTCPILGACGLKRILGEALAAFLATLDRYSLADAARNVKGLRQVLGIAERGT